MNKKKLLVVAMVLSMVAVLAIGGTLAYFTDTDDATNVFTVGNVKIDLTEAEVVQDADGNYDKDGDNRHDVGDDEKEQYIYGTVNKDDGLGYVYPGQYIVKDPTIENQGTEDAYIAAVVTIKSDGDLRKVLPSGVEGSNYINTAHMVQLERDGKEVQVIEGGLASQQATWVDAGYHGATGAYVSNGTEPFTVVQIPKSWDENDEGSEYVLYFFITNPQQPEDKVMLFEKLNFAYDWDNEEMAHFANTSIKIEAYAAQAYGFTNTGAADDCCEAMLAAFPEVFGTVFTSNK